ncbi:MAG: cysteine desulfurase [Verrucomicrobiaceae bacterium]|nr:cysteine desulfurase [Verrucomicrobiaceae bacterium]
MNRYFDYNATTPMSDAARRAWLEATEKHWQNPSSLYRDAGFAKQKLEEARERLATLLGCDAGRIVFTSGATESNNALFASLASKLPANARVAISTIEHPSVREAAHAAFQGRVVRIPVNADGIVEPEAVSEAIAKHTPALVSIMAANNESGALQPLSSIAAICHRADIPFHCDAAQWIGKLPSSSLGLCDYLTGSAHKFGGPKGTGFLVLRDEDEPLHFLRGGPQEADRRAGTENYPAVEAMVTALEELEPRLPSIAREQSSYRDRFVEALRDHFLDLRFISADAERLWNTTLLVMPRHENLKWLTRLSRRGFSISTGSACSSGKEGSSVVVQALGASPEELKRVVRISGGWHHTEADWLALANAFVEVDRELSEGGKPA